MELASPKMSDLEAPTTNLGGRKARLYDGQITPSCRGGVYPSPQRSDRSANPSLGSAQYRFQYVALGMVVKRIVNFVRDVPYDAEVLLTKEGTIEEWQ